MSSINNNLPAQGMITPSVEFNNSRTGVVPMVNMSRPQRSDHDGSSSTSRGRRFSRGRGKRVGSLGHHGRNMDEELSHADSESKSETTRPGPSDMQTTLQSDGRLFARVANHRGANSRGGGGKHRQRQQTSQLIGGMTDLAGLDMGLDDTIASIGSTGGSVEANKGRYSIPTRKVNLTHLLNYKFENRQRDSRHHFRSSESTRDRGSQFRNPGTAHKFSKQQFLQANCQFVVLEGHDYSIHRANADWPVDWDCVEEVRFKQCASTETTCPVCLEPPVAAKVTRCGHIYCWTCMLHYLSLSDETCRQCPICFEPVYKNDLRSVISYSFVNHLVDEEIVMRLMMRKKGCVEVEPYRIGPTGMVETTDCDQYGSQANLVIVDSDTVIENIVEREKSQLLAKLASDQAEPEVCFIDQALSEIETRLGKLRLRGSSTKPQACALEFNHQTNIGSKNSCDVEPSKSYLFYQSSDGQHIYLNPFSTRILCHEYGGLENCPHEIKAKILQIDWLSMSEAWRKRFKYLEHLPLTCEFRLIELDFRDSNLISVETYGLFDDKIKQREQERERRRKEERKREKIIQVEQNRKIYGIQPSLKINLDNMDQFPSVSDERYLGLSQPRNQLSAIEDSSSEDERPERGESVGISSNMADKQTQPDSNRVESELVSDKTSTVTLSFKDIQLEEAAKAANSAAKVKSIGAWSAKKSAASSNPQSSFAQLLVDAKASQKEWTRSTVSSISGGKSASTTQAGSSHWPTLQSDYDEGEEELRAPPCQFTISDFIDMNIISNVGKKKVKSKNSNKKG